MHVLRLLNQFSDHSNATMITMRYEGGCKMRGWTQWGPTIFSYKCVSQQWSLPHETCFSLIEPFKWAQKWLLILGTIFACSLQLLHWTQKCEHMHLHMWVLAPQPYEGKQYILPGTLVTYDHDKENMLTFMSMLKLWYVFVLLCTCYSISISYSPSYYWKSDLPQFTYDYWKCMFVNSFIIFIYRSSQLCSLMNVK